MEAEYIIRNMVRDIDKIRSDYERMIGYGKAMKASSPAIALWAYDYTNERNEDMLEGWDLFVNHLEGDGVFIPVRPIELIGGGHTRMVGEMRSPIWNEIGCTKDEPFAFAGLLSYRIGIQTIAMDDYRNLCRKNHRPDPYENLMAWAMESEM